MNVFALLEPGDIPDGWASIIVAFITVIGGTAVIQIVNIMNTRKNRSAIQDMDTKVNAIRDHTVNSHTDRNMREEMDERYEESRRESVEQRRLLERVVSQQELMQKDVGGIRSELRQERSERHALSERVTALEK